MTQDEQTKGREVVKASIQEAVTALSRLVAEERSSFTKTYQYRLRRALDHLLTARDELE